MHKPELEFFPADDRPWVTLVPSDRSPAAVRREIRSVESSAVACTYTYGFTGHRGSTATLSSPSSCPDASTLSTTPIGSIPASVA